MFAILALSVVFLLSGIYLWVTNRHSYWKRRNIPGPTPTFFAGNLGDSVAGKKNMGEVYGDIYRDYKNYPFVGIYKIFTPALLVTDVEVVKNILIKDFDSFTDNTIPFDSNMMLFKKHPFVLNGQEWKTSRQKIAPLVSLAKVKSGISIFNTSANQMVAYIKKKAKADGSVTLQAKDVTGRLTANNVASWGLGLDAKCFESDSPEFVKLSKTLFEFSFKQNMSFLLALTFPSLIPYLDTSIMPRKSEARVVDIVNESIKYREESNVDRNDYLGGLLNLKKAGSIPHSDIVPHFGSIYADGVESASVGFHFILYEIAANPHCQEKLKKEIDEVLGNNSEITVEIIQNMKYLDAVFNEALRLHLVLNFIERQTTKRCKLSGMANNGKQMEVTLEPGTAVIIPTMGMHLDEKFFPDPQSFKPERFLSDNKESITKYTFMPFGEGPRICLGKNFATYQIKVGLIYLLKNFKMSLDEKTPYPIILNPTSFLVLPKEPISINFQERK